MIDSPWFNDAFDINPDWRIVVKSNSGVMTGHFGVLVWTYAAETLWILTSDTSPETSEFQFQWFIKGGDTLEFDPSNLSLLVNGKPRITLTRNSVLPNPIQIETLTKNTDWQQSKELKQSWDFRLVTWAELDKETGNFTWYFDIPTDYPYLDKHWILPRPIAIEVANQVLSLAYLWEHNRGKKEDRKYTLTLESLRAWNYSHPFRWWDRIKVFWRANAIQDRIMWASYVVINWDKPSFYWDVKWKLVPNKAIGLITKAE